ncbi:MAG TPA: DUF1232 domain-containing protein [Acidobacteriota bacterium]|jgi:uncharacterized membrane protein YkvA (DUF1232 family)
MVEPVEDLEKRDAKERFKNLLRYMPDLIRLLYRLLRDPRVSSGDKAILGAVMVYVVNPFDLIPDAIPVLGQVDDIYLISLAVLRLLNRTDPSVLSEHWQRNEDIVAVVEELAELSLFFLPRRLRSLLVGKLDRWEKGKPA